MSGDPGTWVYIAGELRGVVVADAFKDHNTVYLRTARKEHHCWGGHDGERHTRCGTPIQKGERYIEYVGESPPFQSGQRYHFECARQQGLIELRAAPGAGTPRPACSRGAVPQERGA